ncbi:ammonium transporter [Sorangium sp. So ce131]|uniref:ammonium transporter n=1 Tax=Sorangium sp. So ce131 TaxID=3133282 RepID=UPI003F5E1C32
MADPTLAELTRQLADTQHALAHTQTALNLVWILIAAFLVMFMQAGFALLETGLTRAKNVAHTMGMNYLVYAIGILGFWSVGFAFQMGGVGALATLGGDATLSRELAVTIDGKELGLLGLKGFFLTPECFTPAVAAMFLFQMAFMDTTATIPTGAMAERWKFTSFVLFSFVISTVIYPVYANWVWGGGWLSALGRHFGLGHGHVDFAGSSVVHLTGGTVALVGARMLGPRLGKFGPDGSVRPIPGHSIPLLVTGTFILAFGWFGFNAGSTLAGTDVRISIVATNTMLASAAGAFSSYLYVSRRFGKPDVTMLCNGMLAGLVAITASCAFVAAPAAIAIGAIAGVLVVWGAVFVETRLKIDDPVGAIAVHGMNGTWGVLALGLFADGTYGHGLNGVAGPVRGLLYGDARQLAAQCVGLAANVLYVGAVATAALRTIDKLVGNRVSEEVELTGLDEPEMGMEGYAAAAGPYRPAEPAGLPGAEPPDLVGVPAETPP